MRRLLTAALSLVLFVWACSTFLPERYAVNVPLRSFILGAQPPPRGEFIRRMKVPEGFSIGIFAQGISNARFMRFTSAGDLLVSSPRESTIFLLERDQNGDGRADGVRPLLQGLDRPHGLDFHGDWLYVAERDAVRRVRYDALRRTTQGQLETIVSNLPKGGTIGPAPCASAPTAGCTSR